MKTAIYYFSATGNTLAIAKDVAACLGGAELIPMTRYLKSGIAGDYDRVGIAFPVYVLGLPLIVAEFLRTVRIKEGAYIFAVTNYGGLQGRALSQAKQILQKRGLELSCGFSIKMPGNYTPLYGAIPEDKQKKMFDDEKRMVGEICGAVQSSSRGIMQEKPVIPNLLLYVLLYNIGIGTMKNEDKAFWVTDKCTKCGLCERVCPVDNIKLIEGKPSWLHHCEQCMACLQWCPVEAIQYKKATLKRKRYHNPLVTVKDILSQKEA